jgi:hypothetical protein
VPTFGWTVLAPKPRVKMPALPTGKWSAETRQWWRVLWRRPQAVMWDPTGLSLRTAARLYEAIVRGESALAPLSAELRQIEDRHGLNPRAMLQLRWRIADPGDLEGVAAGPDSTPGAGESSLPAARRRRLLREAS